jgi:hypothetical protein
VTDVNETVRKTPAKAFADLPKEHPYLRLDEPVRILDQRSPFFGRIGYIDNIVLGDRAGIWVRFDAAAYRDIRSEHERKGTLGRAVGDVGRRSIMVTEYNIVPTRDEHEMLIGDWTFTAHVKRNTATGQAEKIVVTGPTIRAGDAVFDHTEFPKETPVDALTGAITKAFMELVAPKIIQRITQLEDLVPKITEGKLL